MTVSALLLKVDSSSVAKSPCLRDVNSFFFCDFFEPGKQGHGLSLKWSVRRE